MEPVQFKMARAALGLSLRQVGEELNLSTNTLVRFESGGDSRHSTVKALRDYMTARGIEFLTLPDGRLGVAVQPKE